MDAPLAAALKRVVEHQIIGRHATVAPSADDQAIWVRDPLCDRVINRGKIVLHIDSAPGPVDAHRVFGPAAGRAARIRQDHGVTVGREELLFELELVGEL